MKTYNIGIIGYGGFGRFLRHWWDKLENVQVVAVSDTNPLDSIKEGVTYYRNWEDLIADTTIDIVSIATPPYLHVEIACAAMRNGKHVLLEKPIALTEEGAQEILRTQEETGMVVTIDHMLRYNPIIKALIQLSHKETFGKLRHVEVTNYAQDEGLPAGHWFWDKEVSGGIFIEHGVHFFDIVNALTNQHVTKVLGSAHNRNSRQQDQVAATVLFNNGLIASHYHSFSGPGFFEQTTIRLSYDLARIEVEGWMPMNGRISVLLNKAGSEAIRLLPGLHILEEVPIANVSDISRPEGWGSTQTATSGSISSAGITYEAEELVKATFKIEGSKSEAYGSCLQQIVLDIISKIENPSQVLQITPEDAYNALKVALMAEASANKKQ